MRYVYLAKLIYSGHMRYFYLAQLINSGRMPYVYLAKLIYSGPTKYIYLAKFIPSETTRYIYLAKSIYSIPIPKLITAETWYHQVHKTVRTIRSQNHGVLGIIFARVLVSCKIDLQTSTLRMAKVRFSETSVNM
jgi:hypothetical protein